MLAKRLTTTEAMLYKTSTTAMAGNHINQSNNNERTQ